MSHFEFRDGSAKGSKSNGMTDSCNLRLLLEFRLGLEAGVRRDGEQATEFDIAWFFGVRGDTSRFVLRCAGRNGDQGHGEVINSIQVVEVDILTIVVIIGTLAVGSVLGHPHVEDTWPRHETSRPGRQTEKTVLAVSSTRTSVEVTNNGHFNLPLIRRNHLLLAEIRVQKVTSKNMSVIENASLPCVSVAACGSSNALVVWMILGDSKCILDTSVEKVGLTPTHPKQQAILDKSPENVIIILGQANVEWNLSIATTLTSSEGLLEGKFPIHQPPAHLLTFPTSSCPKFLLFSCRMEDANHRIQALDRGPAVERNVPTMPSTELPVIDPNSSSVQSDPLCRMTLSSPPSVMPTPHSSNYEGLNIKVKEWLLSHPEPRTAMLTNLRIGTNKPRRPTRPRSLVLPHRIRTTLQSGLDPLSADNLQDTLQRAEDVLHNVGIEEAHQSGRGHQRNRSSSSLTSILSEPPIMLSTTKPYRPRSQSQHRLRRSMSTATMRTATTMNMPRPSNLSPLPTEAQSATTARNLATSPATAPSVSSSASSVKSLASIAISPVTSPVIVPVELNRAKGGTDDNEHPPDETDCLAESPPRPIASVKLPMPPAEVYRDAIKIVTASNPIPSYYVQRLEIIRLALGSRLWHQLRANHPSPEYLADDWETLLLRFGSAYLEWYQSVVITEFPVVTTGDPSFSQLEFSNLVFSELHPHGPTPEERSFMVFLPGTFPPSLSPIVTVADSEEPDKSPPATPVTPWQQVWTSFGNLLDPVQRRLFATPQPALSQPEMSEMPGHVSLFGSPHRPLAQELAEVSSVYSEELLPPVRPFVAKSAGSVVSDSTPHPYHSGLSALFLSDTMDVQYQQLVFAMERRDKDRGVDWVEEKEPLEQMTHLLEHFSASPLGNSFPKPCPSYFFSSPPPSPQHPHPPFDFFTDHPSAPGPSRHAQPHLSYFQSRSSSPQGCFQDYPPSHYFESPPPASPVVAASPSINMAQPGVGPLPQTVGLTAAQLEMLLQTVGSIAQSNRSAWNPEDLPHFYPDMPAEYGRTGLVNGKNCIRDVRDFNMELINMGNRFGHPITAQNAPSLYLGAAATWYRQLSQAQKYRMMYEPAPLQILGALSEAVPETRRVLADVFDTSKGNVFSELMRNPYTVERLLKGDDVMQWVMESCALVSHSGLVSEAKKLQVVFDCFDTQLRDVFPPPGDMELSAYLGVLRTKATSYKERLLAERSGTQALTEQLKQQTAVLEDKTKQVSDALSQIHAGPPNAAVSFPPVFNPHLQTFTFPTMPPQPPPAPAKPSGPMHVHAVMPSDNGLNQFAQSQPVHHTFAMQQPFPQQPQFPGPPYYAAQQPQQPSFQYQQQQFYSTPGQFPAAEPPQQQHYQQPFGPPQAPYGAPYYQPYPTQPMQPTAPQYSRPFGSMTSFPPGANQQHMAAAPSFSAQGPSGYQQQNSQWARPTSLRPCRFCNQSHLDWDCQYGSGLKPCRYCNGRHYDSQCRSPAAIQAALERQQRANQQYLQGPTPPVTGGPPQILPPGQATAPSYATGSNTVTAGPTFNMRVGQPSEQSQSLQRQTSTQNVGIVDTAPESGTGLELPDLPLPFPSRYACQTCSSGFTSQRELYIHLYSLGHQKAPDRSDLAEASPTDATEIFFVASNPPDPVATEASAADSLPEPSRADVSRSSQEQASCSAEHPLSGHQPISVSSSVVPSVAVTNVGIVEAIIGSSVRNSAVGDPSYFPCIEESAFPSVTIRYQQPATNTIQLLSSSDILAA
ncbi:hypothetical protein BJ508DRAFT_315262, partial [Ascobolus immersus RN42]